MTVIELGEVSSGSAPEPRDRPIRGIDIRRFGLAVVAVLCLLAVTGSARPEPRSLPTLWSMPFHGDQFTLAEDALYLLEPSAGSSITSYDAATGRLRWSRALPQLTAWMYTDVPGLLLVPVMGATDLRQVVSETIALDSATGAERWRQPGEVAITAGETVLLVEWDPAGERFRRMRLVRAVDGSQVWTYAPDPAMTSWTTLGPDPRRPDRVATVTAQGGLEVRRFADRTLVTAGTVPWVVPSDRDDRFAYLFGAGDLLYVVRTIKGEQDIYAYRADTLDRLWEMRTDASAGTFDCGRVLCVDTPDTGVDGRDPRTGRRLWHGEGWDWARPLGDGRLLAQSHENGRSGLVDATTGRVVVDLGPANNVLEPETGRILVVGTTRTEPYGSKITELEDSGEVIVRGILGPVSDQGCQALGRRLACAVAGGRLTVRDVG